MTVYIYFIRLTIYAVQRVQLKCSFFRMVAKDSQTTIVSNMICSYWMYCCYLHLMVLLLIRL